MANESWTLQPNEEPVEDEVEDTTVSSTEVSTDESAGGNAPSIEDVLARIERMESANANAERVSNDLRRSVGQIQSLVDRLQQATGAQRQHLESQLNQRFDEVSGLLEETVEGIPAEIMNESTRARIRSARAAAQAQAQQASLDQRVEERVREMLRGVQTAAPPAQGVPNEWISLEREMESEIKNAGLDPDGSEFDWNYAGYMLRNGRPLSDVRAYFEGIIEANSARLQARKGVESPTGSGGGDSRDPLDKLSDRSLSIAERAKILRDAGAIR